MVLKTLKLRSVKTSAAIRRPAEAKSAKTISVDDLVAPGTKVSEVSKVPKASEAEIDKLVGGTVPKVPEVSEVSEVPSAFAKASTYTKVSADKSTDKKVSDISNAKPIFIDTRSRIGFNGFVDNRIIPDANVPTEIVKGALDLEQNGHGILRPDFTPGENDIYISSSQIRRFQLRPGDIISGPARRPKDNERYWGLLKVEKVNGITIDKLTKRPQFDRLTPIYPDEQLRLETDQNILSTRIIDLVAPIGKGQRGLIVSPPKAGKTTILKQIANGITANHPKVHLMAVLVGERPEEATDIRRNIKGEVIASHFDDPPDRQAKSAEIALERAKRLVEIGTDVVILLDSITRLARAYNLAMPTSGRTLTGGFDPAALYPAKRFLGAARKFEEGGSLTIIGTTLVDTGSRMDELIYEEFKGTGNMELHLDRALEERRIFPAINAQRSGTRKEELLLDPKTYQKMITVRRMLDVLSKDERTELLLERLGKFKTNKEFLESLNQG